MRSHDHQKRLLTTAEAAARLGLATKTLHKWRVHGGGPVFHKFGSAVRYDPGNLDEFAAARAFRTTAEADAQGRGR
jgi:hypothetical protein